MKISPYSKQSIDNRDIKSVLKILKSDFITQGPEILKFEKNFAKYVNSKYAVACNSGTAALHIACQALGINKKSNVIAPTITFVASANCAAFTGAKIYFSDIETKTHCINVTDLENQLKKKKIDLVVVVHMAGHPAEMKKINQLKKKYKFKIIEDSCHALGGKYFNQKVGSCFFSDISTFSFHPVKPITTAEGGMITTNDKKIFQKLLLFRTHGISKISNNFENKNLAFDKKNRPNQWYYEMTALGHNYRITDIQAALGNSQLKRIDKFINHRRKIAKIYNQELRNNKFLQLPFEGKNIKHAYHLYTILVDFKNLKKERNQVMRELREKKIGSQVLYIPVHLQPFYRKKNLQKNKSFKNALNYYNKCLSIPIYFGLSEKKAKFIAKQINKVIS